MKKRPARIGKKENTGKSKNPKAYTLDTPRVQAYITFVAVREMGLVHKILPEDCQNEAQFCRKHGLSENSTATLWNYKKIKGFWEVVEKEKRNYKGHLLEIGMAGLTKLAQGMTLKKQALFWGKPVDVKEEVAPHEKACERLVQLGGGDISDKIQVEGSSVAAAFREAAKAEAEGGKG
jgi:hypothetical protein